MINSITDYLFFREKPTIPSMIKDMDGPGVSNSALVDRVERPKEGGILVYLVNYKYPYKGLPDKKAVENLHLVKKIIFHAFEAINNRGCKVWIGFLLILPRFLTRPLLNAVIWYFQRLSVWHLYDDYLIPERYCVCVRELWRAIGAVADKEKDEFVKKVLLLARELVCMSIEFDSAYRFRLQDIFFEAIKDELLGHKNRMAKEMDRLFDVLISRERDMFRPMIPKWRQLKEISRVIPKVWFIRKRVQAIIKELDFEKLKPDAGDDYFNLLRQDYEFKGIPLPQRIEIRKEIEGDNWRYFGQVADGFLLNYNNHKQKEAIKK